MELLAHLVDGVPLDATFEQGFVQSMKRDIRCQGNLEGVHRHRKSTEGPSQDSSTQFQVAMND